MDLASKTTAELDVLAGELQQDYDRLRGRNIGIDMTRGKPAPNSWTSQKGCWRR
jgi:hypothetical protein